MVNIQMTNLMEVYSINYLQYIPHYNACIAGNSSLIIAFGLSTTGQLVDTMMAYMLEGDSWKDVYIAVLYIYMGQLKVFLYFGLILRLLFA